MKRRKRGGVAACARHGLKASTVLHDLLQRPRHVRTIPVAAVIELCPTKTLSRVDVGTTAGRGLVTRWSSPGAVSLPETSRARLEPDDNGWDHGGRRLRVSRYSPCVPRPRLPVPGSNRRSAGREISDRPS
jgi:hypothetical protein